MKDEILDIDLQVIEYAPYVYKLINKGKKDLILFYDAKKYKNGNVKPCSLRCLPSGNCVLFDKSINLKLEEIYYKVADPTSD